MPVYLITEAELRSIEEYQAASEREKQSWLLQVQELKAKADSLHRDSGSLSNQLSEARKQNRNLEQSFNEYEAENLITISLKNGEIADLKQTVADKTLEAEKHKGVSRGRLYAIIGLAGAWAVFIIFKAGRFFRLF
ncbi:MAG: hypothetical protein LBC57_04230 [Treponema sp.]|nr:hypothetical protein [Treponema sp.]